MSLFALNSHLKDRARGVLSHGMEHAPAAQPGNPVPYLTVCRADVFGLRQHSGPCGKRLRRWRTGRRRVAASGFSLQGRARGARMSACETCLDVWLCVKYVAAS